VTSPQIIRRAERLPNGRVKGESPPILIPRVLRMMTPLEQIRLRSIEEKRRAVFRESRAFLVSLGLDPKGEYVFHTSGAVTERGRWRPIY
jgi:hypothetical protein